MKLIKLVLYIYKNKLEKKIRIVKNKLKIIKQNINFLFDYFKT